MLSREVGGVDVLVGNLLERGPVVAGDVHAPSHEGPVDDGPHAHGAERQEDAPGEILEGGALVDHRWNHAEDQDRDAHDERSGEQAARAGALLGGVEVLDVGVLATEGRALQPRRDDEHEPDRHQDEKWDGGDTLARHTHRIPVYLQVRSSQAKERSHERRRRSGKNEQGDAGGDAEGEAARMFVVAADVSGRAGGHPGRGHVLLTGGEVSAHEVVERAIKDLAELEELVHLGVGALGLPLGDALAGDAHQHGELLLGHVARGAEVLQVVAEAHGCSFGWPAEGAAWPASAQAACRLPAPWKLR